jgi:mannosyltransferase OCH1-like enzyme
MSLTDLADLVRIFTLYDNGGMWMDASIFAFNNLDWVHNLDNELFIYNKAVTDP